MPFSVASILVNPLSPSALHVHAHVNPCLAVTLLLAVLYIVFANRLNDQLLILLPISATIPRLVSTAFKTAIFLTADETENKHPDLTVLNAPHYHVSIVI